MYMLIKGPRAWQCQCCMRRPMYAGACLYRFARYIYIGVKCHMTSSSKDTPPLTQTAKCIICTCALLLITTQSPLRVTCASCVLMLSLQFGLHLFHPSDKAFCGDQFPLRSCDIPLLADSLDTFGSS